MKKPEQKYKFDEALFHAELESFFRSVGHSGWARSWLTVVALPKRLWNPGMMPLYLCRHVSGIKGEAYYELLEKVAAFAAKLNPRTMVTVFPFPYEQTNALCEAIYKDSRATSIVLNYSPDDVLDRKFNHWDSRVKDQAFLLTRALAEGIDSAVIATMLDRISSLDALNEAAAYLDKATKYQPGELTEIRRRLSECIEKEEAVIKGVEAEDALGRKGSKKSARRVSLFRRREKLENYLIESLQKGMDVSIVLSCLDRETTIKILEDTAAYIKAHKVDLGYSIHDRRLLEKIIQVRIQEEDRPKYGEERVIKAVTQGGRLEVVQS